MQDMRLAMVDEPASVQQKSLEAMVLVHNTSCVIPKTKAKPFNL